MPEFRINSSAHERASVDIHDSNSSQENHGVGPLPVELQLLIFSLLNICQLATSSLVCKKWNDLTKERSLWKALGTKMGLSFFSENPKQDCHLKFAFSRLQFTKTLDREIVAKLEELPIWKEPIEIQPQTHEIYNVVALSKLQNLNDGNDYFGKKIEAGDLYFFFIKAERWKTLIVKISLTSSLCWKSSVLDGHRNFLFEKTDTPEWIDLQKKLREIFDFPSVPHYLEDFDSWGHLNIDF